MARRATVGGAAAGPRLDSSDGPAALELVRRRAYDVALLDFKMPGMDGLTLYRELRKVRAETVAIVVTAYASRSPGNATPPSGTGMRGFR